MQAVRVVLAGNLLTGGVTTSMQAYPIGVTPIRRISIGELGGR